MTKLNDIYKHDISRPIQNVIKIGENQEVVKQELEEYVVTKEIRRHLDTFFRAYTKSINSNTDEIGVWISGFYGSGKSHLLKILSYLLENHQTVDGRYAVDYFKEKINDEMLYADIKRAGEIDSKIILFNISSVANIDTVTNKKDQILTVFEKQFNEAIGLCTLPTCAAFERYLISINKYEEFKNKYKEYTNLDWNLTRRMEFHRKDKIRKPYAEVCGMSEDDAQRSLDEITRIYNDNMSIDYFTNIVKEYVDKQSNNFHIVFLIDEIGQYMEDDTSLMLNLQTIVEDLGKKCNGKVWVIVTSQEEIDRYTRVKGSDFSKILARFNTRLNLTSSDIEEVIKKRLLEKKNSEEESYYQILKNVYEENEITIRNLMEFKGGETQKIYTSQEDFADVYPFIPYQFNILQEVYDNIRKYGYTGKSISRGERTLISSTQFTALKFRDDAIGTIIPFYAFYDSVEKELDTKNIQTINKAKEKIGMPGGLKEIDINVLELLFMLRNLKELPANIENISTLFVSNINDNKDAIKRTIKESLNRLERETLIQRNNDVYQFLTDEEQEINKAINAYHVQESTISEYIADIIYGENYSNRRYTYNKQSFDLVKYLDDKNYGYNEGKIGIKIYTDEVSSTFLDNNYAYIYLNLNRETRDEIKRSLRIHAYRQDQRGVASESERMTEILATKSAEEKEINSRVKIIIQEAVKSAPIYISGSIKDIKSSDIVARFEEAFVTLINNVYSKFNYIKRNYTVDDIRTLWNNKNVQMSLGTQTYTNGDAYEEVKWYCTTKSNSYNDLSINELVSHFDNVPFGFLETDTEYILTLLLRNEEISLYSNNRTLDNYADDTLNKIIKKDSQTIIKLRKKVDKSKIDIINNLARQTFKEILPDDEDGMKKKFKEILLQKIDGLKEIYNVNYKKSQKYEYPGKEVLEKTIKLLEDINNIDDINDFFDSINEEQDEIKNNIEETNKIKDFLEDHIKIFDKARDIMEYCDNSKTFIDMSGNNEKLNECINETKEILKMKEPYGSMPRLKELCGEMGEIPTILVDIYDRVAEPIIQEINETKLYVMETAEKYSIESGLNIFKERCDKALEVSRTSKKLESVYAQKSVNESIKNDFDRFVNDYLYEKNKEKVQEGINTTELVKEKKIILTPAMITKGKEYSIKTEQDIDEYLDDIKKNLLDQLNQNENIIIK